MYVVNNYLCEVFDLNPRFQIIRVFFVMRFLAKSFFYSSAQINWFIAPVRFLRIRRKFMASKIFPK